MTRSHSMLGNLIKNQTGLLGKSYSELAAECNVSRGQINHILYGRSNPSLKLLIKLSNHLEVDMDILLKALLK